MIAYFDAAKSDHSNNTDQPLVHTVGAFVGNCANWRRFRREWKLELSKKGLDHFHMTDFEFALSRAKSKRPIPRGSPFYGWNEDDFIPFLVRLHRTISRKSDGIFRLKSFSSSTLTKDFDKTLPVELEGNSKCSSHYIFSVWVIMCAIARWAAENAYDEKIHYIFSGGDREGGNLDRFFNELMNSKIDRKFFRLNSGNTRRLGYGIESMKDEPALQAADIITFEAHKVALKWPDFVNAKNPSDLMRKSLISLSKSQYLGWIYDEARCKQTFAEIVRFESERTKRGLK